MEQGSETGDLVIAGFWRRLGAFAFDAMVLGLVGLLVGTLLFEPLARAGGYALIPGFVMALAYFGVGNSRLMDGETLGKKVVGIRVVDSLGNRLELPRAMLRYTVLGTPYFLGCIPFAVIGFHPVAYFVGAVSAIGQAVLLYLFVFNRRTRQSLHDLLLGTYVVRAANDAARPPILSMWRGHWVVVGLIALLALVSPFVNTVIWSGPLKAMAPVMETLIAQPHVLNASLTQNSVTVDSRTLTRVLAANIQLDEPWIERADVARRFADIIGASRLDLSHEDKVTVSLTYGFNMGIAHGSRWHAYAYRPDELVPATAAAQ